MNVRLINKLDNESLKKVAEIHKYNYPNDHLTSHFSVDLLIDYYSLIAESSEFIYLAFHDNKVVGFSFLGYSFSKILPSLIRKNIFKLLLLFLKKPMFLFGFVINMLLSRKYNLNTTSNIRLISITVDKRYKVHRIGNKLISAINSLQINKTLNVGLSVKASNIAAVNFYIKNGFLIEGYNKDKLFMVRFYA